MLKLKCYPTNCSYGFVFVYQNVELWHYDDYNLESEYLILSKTGQKDRTHLSRVMRKPKVLAKINRVTHVHAVTDAVLMHLLHIEWWKQKSSNCILHNFIRAANTYFKKASSIATHYRIKILILVILKKFAIIHWSKKEIFDQMSLIAVSHYM